MRAFSLAAVAADAPAAGTDITNQLTNVTLVLTLEIQFIRTKQAMSN